jgi:NADH dehydrogenase FAD-containing subunit
VRPGEPLPEGVPPFEYRHKGSLAYIGNDKAVMAIPGLSAPLLGYGAGTLRGSFNVVLMLIMSVETGLRWCGMPKGMRTVLASALDAFFSGPT